jgi:Predicted transcriptional regulator
MEVLRKICVRHHFLVCLEDGKKLKMLKRHLMARYQMTPGDYRQKWNLPADYPMVAPNYAEHRRELAKSVGFQEETAVNRNLFLTSCMEVGRQLVCVTLPGFDRICATQTEFACESAGLISGPRMRPPATQMTLCAI